jgi:hypothetical protein
VRRAPLALVLGTVFVLAGCAAGRRIDNGVYHSTKGYRLTVPGADWRVAEDSRADLELRHHDGTAAMLANAQCDAEAQTRSANLLLVHLLIGIRDRETIEQEETSLNGQRAVRRVLDGRLDGAAAPTRIEAYVVKDGRCVYDFVYAAPVSSFDVHRAQFRNFVESFARERPE